MYDIRLMKLISGDLVIGKYDAEKDSLSDVGLVQFVPGATPQAVQMLILPYGHPFENKFQGTIEGKHFLYRYASTPQEIQDKYIELVTNLTMAGGLGTMKFQDNVQSSKLVH